MGLSHSTITKTIVAFKRMETTSLDCIYSENEEGSGATLLNLIASGEDVEEAAITQEWHKELHRVLMLALRELPEYIREVIVRRFFWNISYRRQAKMKGVTCQVIYNHKIAAFTAIRTGKYGGELAQFLPTIKDCKRAQRRIKQDKEAIKHLQLTEEEKELLIL